VTCNGQISVVSYSLKFNTNLQRTAIIVTSTPAAAAAAAAATTTTTATIR
jgi:hypothetical protein